MLELTCCAEEGIAAAQVRKESRYQGLLDEINAAGKWTAQLLTIEVGARGQLTAACHFGPVWCTGEGPLQAAL